MNESIKEIHNLLQEIVEHLGANTRMECARRSLSCSGFGSRLNVASLAIPCPS